VTPARPAPPAGVAVVVAGGPLSSPAAPAGPPVPGIPDDAWVVAADSGLDRARALGLRVDAVVGDMDSVSPGALDAAAQGGVDVDRRPEAKDDTDLALAVDAALARRPAQLVVVGADGGRLDHVLATALLLTGPALAGVAVEAWLGPARLVVVRPGAPAALAGRPGDLVSLLPMHGPALGVTTEGLLYPLRDEDLPAGSTRGVSNELAADAARVALRRGVLAAVLPGEAGTHLRRGVGPTPPPPPPPAPAG
jgi:thiamine pyrophosphokinase